ncbi:hypothetical protein AX15_001508 [Amanita polypyramis BW_CC]|nr:hypothetical protein AX15_001508 [Amanita polypyramis BW_CC]
MPPHQPNRSRSLAWIPAIGRVGSLVHKTDTYFASLNLSTCQKMVSDRVVSTTSVTQKQSPTTDAIENAPPAAASSSSQRPTSRSRTILKFLTAKIRPTSPTPPLPSPSVTSPPGKTHFSFRAPPPPDSQPAKEKREAALRERGLLPPLKPKKDLSRLEREHDTHLPVSPVEDTTVTIASPTGIETITAANLIKKEWEAKNHSREDDERRFKSFRFGAISSPVHESGADEPASEPCESRLPPQQDALPRQDDPEIPHPSDHAECVSAGRRSQDSTERDQGLRQLSPNLVPLPPSPTPPASPNPIHAKASLELVPPSPVGLYSPALVPLPPSPTESTCPPLSLTIGPGETHLVPIGLITPIISLSPVAEEADPIGEDNTAQGRQRNASVSESQVSLATPSLDSTGTSMLGTTESSPRIKTTTLTGAKNIPMIVESPIEEGPIIEMSMSSPDVEAPNVEAQQDPLEEYQKIKARRKKRTIFGQDPSKRLTVSTSLTNMRRSFANTLSRTKSSIIVKGQKKDDMPGALHIPPLPASPLISRGRSLEVSTASVLRQPVSPTLYSPASIIMETSAIEDEELRRVTELAFLG